MKTTPGIWVIGLVISAVIHLGAGAGLLAALQPQPTPDQPVPKTRLTVEAQDVRRSAAKEQAPQSENTASQAPSDVALNAGAIAQSAAASLAVPLRRTPAQDPQTLSKPTPSTALPAAVVPVTVTPAAKTVQTDPQQTVQTASLLAPVTADLQIPRPDKLPKTNPESTVALSQVPQKHETSAQVPKGTSSKAVLAFPTEGKIDPVSLAAFQGFMQSEDTSSTDIRDSLSAALSVPCARMQVTFNPETTTLQLTGHVPDTSQRTRVLAVLQSQMGTDIDVADNLLILPAPQCAALSGIANTGLPQSTDQITNPMIVGENTHARAFHYTAGDSLVIELTAPDYPAFVYVDYFDADGNVIHLAPNSSTPLQKIDAKAPLQIGARAAGQPGLFVTIGPPFGQEIAAAFASSVPLYDGNRPLIEPAEPYLVWLRSRVAEARATHEDFKGEWVYFFVTTSAG